jgi:hypothetical protein
MAEHEHPGAPVENPEIRHEPSEIRISGILFFGVGLLVLTVIAYVCLWGMMAGLGRREDVEKQSAFPLAVEQRRQLQTEDRQPLPPSPRLEGISPAQRALQGEPGQAPEVVELNRRGWIDEQAGLVNLPVEEAMRSLPKSLPARKEGSDAEPRLPTRASSGRAPEGGRP